MRRIVELLCVLSAVGGASGFATASQWVVPRGAGVSGDLARREGNDGFHLPGRYAPSRVLVVYRGPGLGVGAPGRLVGGLRLRRDGPRNPRFVAHRFLTTVTLSARGVAIPSAIGATSFVAAHGTDLSVVTRRRKADYPAAPKPQNPPAPFQVRVRFDRPFVLPKGASLCVDIVSEPETGGRRSHYWYCDAERFAWSKSRGSTSRRGSGCPFGFQLFGSVPPLDGETPLRITAYTRVTSPRGAPAFLAFGASATRWGRIALPMPLPNAPGCRLYLAPAWISARWSEPGDPRGAAHFAVPLPQDPRLAGLAFFAQAFVVDPAANQLGLRSSHLLRVTLGSRHAPLPARILYDSGPTLDDVPTASLDMGLVLAVD